MKSVLLAHGPLTHLFKMEPTRETHATLVDLLDRILDKGLVINADIIISVAGIPLIGVNLRAAIAGMETMLKYGVMQAWDEKSRVWEREHRKKKEVALVGGEEISLKMFGSFYYSKGIYTAWKEGNFYLTDKRLLLYQQDFDKIIYEIPLEEIKGLLIRDEEHFVKGKKKQVLYLINKDNNISRLHPKVPEELKGAIEEKMKSMGLSLEENPVVPEFIIDVPTDFLTGGEEIKYRERKIWYLEPAKGIQKETWRPGILYLTNKRVCWLSSFDEKLVFDIPVNKILGVNTEMRKVSALDSNKEKVLDILYQADSSKKIASFCGGKIDEWESVLDNIIPAKAVAV